MAATVRVLRATRLGILHLLVVAAVAGAQDVTVRPDAGGGFVVRDAANSVDRFRFEEDGEIFREGVVFLRTAGQDGLFMGAGAGAAVDTNFFATMEENTAFGTGAYGNADDGSDNAAFGTSTLANLSSGSGNTALGRGALLTQSIGSANTAVGNQSLSSLNSGNENLAIGALAGSGLSSGSDNVYIAALAGGTNESGWIRIGQPGTHDATAIAGKVSLGSDDTSAMLGLRGPDDATDGPMVTFWGDATDQVESGRLRFVEGTGNVNFRGAYVHYDGAANRFHIGSHNTNDQDPANDQNAITVLRSNGFVGVRRDSSISHPLHVGTDTSTGNGAHVTAGGSWTNGSSRSFKEGFEAVDARRVLAQVQALPITRWRYKGEDASAHMGPVAEDFHAAFGLGGDARYIGTVDADGVALAAIQGLAELVDEQRALLAEQRARLDAQAAELARQRERLQAFEHGGSALPR